jgi:hypothetical protein
MIAIYLSADSAEVRARIAGLRDRIAPGVPYRLITTGSFRAL